IPYVDPKKLLDLKFKYEKASDIYSYGVLMWEISSGVPPFKELISKGDLVVLRLFIIDGHRENVIEGTPEDYKELYEKCWNSMPENRPNIKKVLEKFKKMGYGIYEEHNSTFDEVLFLILANFCEFIQSLPVQVLHLYKNIN
ncbi:4861_t:CDS:2, partial [Funneliformis geosporum]